MYRNLLLCLMSFVVTTAVIAETNPYQACPTTGVWVDFDCRPHAGECYNSCPNHKFCAIRNDDRCAFDGPKAVVCYCGYSAQILGTQINAMRK